MVEPDCQADRFDSRVVWLLFEKRRTVADCFLKDYLGFSDCVLLKHQHCKVVQKFNWHHALCKLLVCLWVYVAGLPLLDIFALGFSVDLLSDDVDALLVVSHSELRISLFEQSRYFEVGVEVFWVQFDDHPKEPVRF